MSAEVGQAPVASSFAHAPGVTPPSTDAGQQGFLTDVIVSMGFADQLVVDQAVDQSRLLGKMAETLLVESGQVTEEQLARATAQRNGMPFVDLDQFTIDEGAAQLVGTETARRYRAAPIAFDSDGALIVALADPLDGLAVSDIGVITKSEVRPAVAAEAAIRKLLDTMPMRDEVAPPSVMAEAGSEPDANDGEWSLNGSITSAPEPRLLAVEPPPATELPAELQDRIAEVVSAAVAQAVGSATAPQGDAAELEAQLDAERERSAELIESLTSRVEQLEMDSIELRQQRDRLEIERDELRAALAPPASEPYAEPPEPGPFAAPTEPEPFAAPTEPGPFAAPTEPEPFDPGYPEEPLS